MIYNISKRDKILLAKIIKAEAGGESDLDKMRVCSVIMNRVTHNSFPNTVRDVIFQPKQFSGVHSRHFYYNPLDGSCVDCMRCVEEVMRCGSIIDAYFFCNPKISSRRGFGWMSKMKLVIRGKNHWYYTYH